MSDKENKECLEGLKTCCSNYRHFLSWLEKDMKGMYTQDRTTFTMRYGVYVTLSFNECKYYIGVDPKNTDSTWGRFFDSSEAIFVLTLLNRIVKACDNETVLEMFK